MGACGGDENGSSPAPWARSTPGTPCDRSGPACCRRRPCAKREYHRWLPASVRAATRSVRTRVPPAHTNGSPPFPAIPISILHRLVESDGVVAGGADVIMPVGCGGLPRVGRWWSDLLGSGGLPAGSWWVGDEGLRAYGAGEAWRCPVPSRGGWSGGGRPSGPAEGARRARCLRRTGYGPRNGPAAGCSPALSRHEGALPLDVRGPEQPASLREKRRPHPMLGTPTTKARG